MTSCEKDKLSPAVQKWSQPEITVANHQGATKAIERSSSIWSRQNQDN